MVNLHPGMSNLDLLIAQGQPRSSTLHGFPGRLKPPDLGLLRAPGLWPMSLRARLRIPMAAEGLIIRPYSPVA